MARIILASALAGLLLTACGEDESEDEPIGPVANSEGASLDDWVGEEGGEAHDPGANPHAAGAPEDGPPDNVRAVQGTVRERLDAAGYTYLRVETEAGDMWIAAMGSQHQTGAQITAVGTLMQQFRSNALDRTFPELLLAGRVMDGIVEPDQAPPAGSAQMPGHPPMGGIQGGNPHGGGPPPGGPHGGPPGGPHGGPPPGGPHGGPPGGPHGAPPHGGGGNPHGGPPQGGLPSGHP